MVSPHLTRAGLWWWLAKHSFAAEHMLCKPLCSQSSTFSPRETWTQCSSARTAHQGFYFRQCNPAYEQVLALQGQAPRLQHRGWMALATPALNLAAAEVSNKQDTAETNSLFNLALWHVRHSKVTAESHLPRTTAVIHPFHTAFQAADCTQAQ